MKEVKNAAIGIPVMIADEIRQSIVSVYVGKTKFQPVQWIPPNVAPIIAVIIMILVLSDLVGKHRKSPPAFDPRLHPACGLLRLYR